jgi:hypothetical protein
MYLTLLRLIWPFLVRRSAAYAANYLEARRRKQKELDDQPVERPPKCPPCPPCPSVEASADQKSGSIRNKVWFGASGVLLSAALGLVGYLILRDSQ